VKENYSVSVKGRAVSGTAVDDVSECCTELTGWSL
jgi:hypothetical protein